MYNILFTEKIFRKINRKILHNLVWRKSKTIYEWRKFRCKAGWLWCCLLWFIDYYYSVMSVGCPSVNSIRINISEMFFLSHLYEWYWTFVIISIFFVPNGVHRLHCGEMSAQRHRPNWTRITTYIRNLEVVLLLWQVTQVYIMQIAREQSHQPSLLNCIFMWRT